MIKSEVEGDSNFLYIHHHKPHASFSSIWFPRQYFVKNNNYKGKLGNIIPPVLQHVPCSSSGSLFVAVKHARNSDYCYWNINLINTFLKAAKTKSKHIRELKTSYVHEHHNIHKFHFLIGYLLQPLSLLYICWHLLIILLICPSLKSHTKYLSYSRNSLHFMKPDGKFITVYKSLHPVPILRQMNPLHTLKNHFI